MYRKILIPTDGSPLSKEASEAGIEFARQLGAEIVGVFVGHEYRDSVFLDMIPPSFPDKEEQDEEIKKEGESYLKEIEKAAMDAGLKFSGIYTMADATAKQIVATAEELHCDLILMGSHGRSGWGELLLGSVTSNVLAACQIPVLVYRSKAAPAS